MFRLEEISNIYLLALIPLLVLGYYFFEKQLEKRKMSFGDLNLVNRLMQFQPSRKNLIRFILVITSLFFMIIAAINPQYGFKKEKQKVEKSDIVIALDISSSMNVQDISPSRLEKAKRFAENIIETRRGDQIGLIFFAGGAYLQMPLTSDYAAAQLFIKSASTDMAGTQGTAIGEAINLAKTSVNGKEKNQRALIIISDGEDHDEDAITVAEEAVDVGWHIFTVGVGTEKGDYVPVNSEGREEYKMDNEGNPVTSALNPQLMKDIAAAGNGSAYFLDDQSNIIEDMNTKLEKLQKREVEINSFTEYRSFYQYFLGLALLLLLIEFYISQIAKTNKIESN
jgi:Ca-activated chloride channel family protein